MNLNKKVKNMDILDIILTKGSVFFATLCIVILFPKILFIEWHIFLLIALILAVRPTYKFFKS
ncbi:hypothetical protein KO317_02320 [Candidatus Micrarchaeota archaeon]|nr:hypothetical protein [Candidatus Micrarchaeota archaeon]